MPRLERYETTDGETPLSEVLEVGHGGQVHWFRPGSRVRSRFGNLQGREAILAKARAEGYVEVSPCRVLCDADHGSPLVLEERFRSGDPMFLAEVLACTSAKPLADLSARWFSDRRPVMRSALLAYVEDGCDRPHHKRLVRRLLVLAEREGDDELMGRFMRAVDRMAPRYERRRQSWTAAGSVHRRVLGTDPGMDHRITLPKKHTARFSLATRRYLARRIFRYFRRLGKVDPARYGNAVRNALAHYTELDLYRPERLLDAWSLMHVLYAWSPVVVRNPRGLQVAKGRALSELEPAPYFPAAWHGVWHEVLSLFAVAQSRTVRQWCLVWLRTHYADRIERLTLSELRPLLTSRHEEVALFAASLLANAEGASSIAVTEWIALLETDDPKVLEALIPAFERHVAPARLLLEQCVKLALSSTLPVAELGLQMLRARGEPTPHDLTRLSSLTDSPLLPMRRQATEYLLSYLRQPSHASVAPTVARDLLDCRHAEVRAQAAAFVDGSVAAQGSLAMWVCLAESPYPDVRALVVRHARADRPVVGVSPEAMQFVRSVLLAVQGGSVAKGAILEQLAARAVAEPTEAKLLLPLFGLALRSFRRREQSAALAALVRMSSQNEELGRLVGELFPTLWIADRVSQ